MARQTVPSTLAMVLPMNPCCRRVPSRLQVRRAHALSFFLSSLTGPCAFPPISLCGYPRRSRPIPSRNASAICPAPPSHPSQTSLPVHLATCALALPAEYCAEDSLNCFWPTLAFPYFSRLHPH